MKNDTAIAKPVWVRVPEAVKKYGIGRSKLYALIASGSIKSASLRGEGQSRGTRLVCVNSIEEFIESNVTTAA